MKFKNRQEFLVMLTVAAAALFVGVNFIFTPLQGWWSARQKELNNLRDQVKTGKVMVAREKYLRSQWDDMRANSLPANPPDAEQKFLKAVDGWARDNNVDLTSIMPQWKNDSTNYMTLDCRVETSGDLSALTRFIYDIEKGPMPLRLDTVELSSHDNTGQQLTLGVEINGLALKDKK